MEKQLKTLYEGKAKLISLTCTNTNYWQFVFEDKIAFSTFCFWRLLKANKPFYISIDHKEKFGLKKPLDLVYELNILLKNISLIQIKRDVNSGDSFFIFEENIKIEFYTSSMGYENWSLYIDKRQYVCLGGGEIA